MDLTYTEDSHLSIYSQVQHMKADSCCQILHTHTQTKDALLQMCQGPDEVTEHHPLLSPLMAHQIIGEVSAWCPQHTLAQTPGISQPVPF